MSKPVYHEVKVLPFETKGGARVQGHALIVAEFEEGRVTEVGFWTFDQEIGAPVVKLVHVSHLSRALKTGHHVGEVRFVVLSNGQRIYAKSYSVTFHDEKDYNAAPALCRGVFKITGLCTGTPLVEIAGVGAWAFSKRRPEDDGLILDPWARDNAEFAARMAALKDGN